MNNYPIRIVSQDDIVQVLKCFNNEFPRSVESRVGEMGLYATKLANHAYVFTTKNNDTLTGMVIFYANDFSTRNAFLAQIAVSSDHRTQGLGQSLLEFCCTFSKDLGMEMIKLEVDNSNSKAIKLYEKNNFVTTGPASPDSQFMIRKLH